MNRWAPLGALIAVSVVAYVGYVGFRTGGAVAPAGAAQPTGAAAAVHADYLVLDTLEELTQQAALVAVGTIEGVAGTRNLARSSDDLEIIGFDYRFVVDEFLKGSAPSTILVTEARKWLLHGEEATVAEEPAKEMAPGGRYILFLRETGDGTWMGVAEPWRYALREGEVIVESRWEAAGAAFPVTGEDEFVAQVRAFAGNQ